MPTDPERPPLPKGRSATSLPPHIAEAMQRRRDKLAMKILGQLMRRYQEPGYSDQAAIAEAYRLADVARRL